MRIRTKKMPPWSWSSSYFLSSSTIVVVMTILIMVTATTASTTYQRQYQQNHVYFLRHCVRTTPTNDKNVLTKIGITHSELPKYYNGKHIIKQYDCTNVGKQIIINTGKDIYKTILRRLLQVPVASQQQQQQEQEQSRKHRHQEDATKNISLVVTLNFQIISDIDQRNMDTSRYLIMGIKEQHDNTNNSHQRDISSVDDIQLNFHNYDILKKKDNSKDNKGKGKNKQQKQQQKGDVSSSSSTSFSYDVINLFFHLTSRSQVVSSKKENKCKNLLSSRRKKYGGKYYKQLVQQQIQDRISSIPPPPMPQQQPPTPISSSMTTTTMQNDSNAAAYQIVQRMIQLDHHDDTTSTPNAAANANTSIVAEQPPMTVYFNKDKGSFDMTQHYIDIIQHVSQIVYLSRCSGYGGARARATTVLGGDPREQEQEKQEKQVQEPFLSSNVTIEEVYYWIRWYYYVISLLHVNNTHHTMKGVVVAYSIVHALQYGYIDIDIEISTTTTTATAATTDATTVSTGEEEEESNDDDSLVCEDDDDEDEGDKLVQQYRYYNANITIFVGHDKDLPPIATAFGIRWKLDELQQQQRQDDNDDCTTFTTSRSRTNISSDTSSNTSLPLSYEYLPTPPGSGLHFMYDAQMKHVEMSYVYPIMLRKKTDSDDFATRNDNMIFIPNDIVLNTSGILEDTPLVLVPTTTSSSSNNYANLPCNNAVQCTDDGKRTILAGCTATPTAMDESTSLSDSSWSSSETTGLDMLKRRLLHTLEQYPEAKGCHDGIKNRLVVPPATSPLSSSSFNPKMMMKKNCKKKNETNQASPLSSSNGTSTVTLPVANAAAFINASATVACLNDTASTSFANCSGRSFRNVNQEAPTALLMDTERLVRLFVVIAISTIIMVCQYKRGARRLQHCCKTPNKISNKTTANQPQR